MKKIVLSLVFILSSLASVFAFSDISHTHDQALAIGTLQQKGIIQGYADGSFRPAQTINRAEFLKIVVGAKFSQQEIAQAAVTPSLGDVEKNSWYAPYVYLGLEQQIIGGYPDGTFRPARTINLVEALKIIVETYDIPTPVYIRMPDHWYDPYLDAANGYQLLNNVIATMPSQEMTRGDISQIIFNVITDERLYQEEGEEIYYNILSVVDGDTIRIQMKDESPLIRLLGIDAPEKDGPFTQEECFAQEAWHGLENLLEGKQVRIETDSTQGERDKYDRILAYIYDKDGRMINEALLESGLVLEYTYNTPYLYQQRFLTAEQHARELQRGLWSETTCNVEVSLIAEETAPVQECTIKGNINSDGEKIYHYEGCSAYGVTKIDESKGEQWFCSIQEAEDAGWRVAGNC